MFWVYVILPLVLRFGVIAQNDDYINEDYFYDELEGYEEEYDLPSNGNNLYSNCFYKNKIFFNKTANAFHITLVYNIKLQM